MPEITDNPPAYVRNDLRLLSDALDAQLPGKLPHNVLIATWNLKLFGSVTRKWTSTAGDSPRRDLRSLRAIAEIIRRFDIVAVQEVVGNLRALRDLMRFLGDDWGFLMTDVNRGEDGNNERLAFVFHRSRARPSGIAAELVVKEDLQPKIGDEFTQFARTPYAVSFKAHSGSTCILTTLHVDYGATENGRALELKAIAEWMADWADSSSKFGHNLIALGDFNIDRRGSPLWQNFTSTGLTVPDQLNDSPRTLFVKASDPQLEKYYDQIAFFVDGAKRKLRLAVRDAGHFDFRPYVYTNAPLTNGQLQYRMSDHFPLWAEFGEP